MKLKLNNNADTTLAGAITELDTTLLLAPGSGLNFPTLAAGEFFPLTLTRLTAGNPEREIVYVTARHLDSVTVVRGQEGTTPLTFSANDIASLRATAGVLNGKADLAGAAFTGPISMAGNELADMVLRDYALAYKDNGAISTISLKNGSAQAWAPPAGPVTLSITDWPPAGQHGELLIYGVNLGSAVIAIDGAPVSFINADTGSFTKTNSLNANGGIALQTNGLDFVLFWSPDGGVTRYCKVVR